VEIRYGKLSIFPELTEENGSRFVRVMVQAANCEAKLDGRQVSLLLIALGGQADAGQKL
jgi:hypothetical protein